MANIRDLTNDELSAHIARFERKLIAAKSQAERLEFRETLQRLKAERSRRLEPQASSVIMKAPRERPRALPDAHVDEGVMALKGGRHREAESIFMAAAKQNPSSSAAWCGLGICKLYQLAEDRTMEEALFAFSRAKQVEPARSREIDRLAIEHSARVVESLLQVFSESVKQQKSAKNQAAAGALLAVASTVIGVASERSNFVQFAALGSGATGVGVAVSRLHTIADMEVLQSQIITILLSIRGGLPGLVDVKLPEYAEFERRLSVLDGDSGKKALSGELRDASGARDVSVLLGLGILLAPYIFAWFTLKPGYRTRARIISFTWLAVVLALQIVAVVADKGHR
jgi:hypothetical protein